jgi:hypothetical protein
MFLLFFQGRRQLGNWEKARLLRPTLRVVWSLGLEHPVGIMVFGTEYRETVCVTVTA